MLDKGIKYILQCCRSLFQFAIRRRHLSPWAENPFTAIDLDRIPVENTRRVVIFTADQERTFLEACDSWQFPLFLTLMLTGLRPSELISAFTLSANRAEVHAIETLVDVRHTGRLPERLLYEKAAGMASGPSGRTDLSSSK